MCGYTANPELSRPTHVQLVRIRQEFNFVIIHSYFTSYPIDLDGKTIFSTFEQLVLVSRGIKVLLDHFLNMYGLVSCFLQEHVQWCAK